MSSTGSPAGAYVASLGVCGIEQSEYRQFT